MILTLKTLKDKKACVDQYNMFKHKFGQSVDITPELCVANAFVFDWDWAANNLLSASACIAKDE